MEFKVDIKVGDRIKLKSIDYIKRNFHIFEDQEQDIIKNQNKVFKVIDFSDEHNTVRVDKPIFNNSRPYENDEINKGAVYLYKRAPNIELPEQLFEI